MSSTSSFLTVNISSFVFRQKDQRSHCHQPQLVTTYSGININTNNNTACLKLAFSPSQHSISTSWSRSSVPPVWDRRSPQASSRPPSPAWARRPRPSCPPPPHFDACFPLSWEPFSTSSKSHRFWGRIFDHFYQLRILFFMQQSWTSFTFSPQIPLTSTETHPLDSPSLGSSSGSHFLKLMKWFWKLSQKWKAVFSLCSDEKQIQILSPPCVHSGLAAPTGELRSILAAPRLTPRFKIFFVHQLFSKIFFFSQSFSFPE